MIPNDKNEYQIRAARHFRGPMLVLAGPGSGKTTVITERIRILTDEYGVAPEHILVITFTRAAAREMKTRYLSLVHRDLPPSEPQAQQHTTRVSFGTFHSVFFTILRTAYGYTADNILRGDVRYQFFRDYIHTHSIDTDDEQEFIRSVGSEISLLKNTGTSIDRSYSNICSAADFRAIYRAYQEFLQKNNLIDFDDMLTKTLRLFQEHEAHRKAWQKKFPFILIDEFQDINQIQYQIIQMLAEPEQNLFIVGDDDQSIYRFRGAEPQIMLNFTKDYPHAKTVYLPVNYRCGEEIMQAAQNLISRNQMRYEKDSVAASENPGTVIRKEFPDQRLQNLYIIGEIRKQIAQGVPPAQIAVLARTNAGLDDLAEMLSSYHIAWQSKERVPSLYDHWIAKDLFTYLHIAQGDASRSNFLRIMNRPNRYLSRELLPQGPVDFYVWRARYASQDWMVKRIDKLREDLSVIRGMRPYAAVTYIRRAAAYDDYIKAHADARGIPEEDLFEILDTLTERSKAYETVSAWEQQIARLASESMRRIRQMQGRNDAVMLATYHGAKGLEYRTVFLPDLCEGITPYKRAVLDEDIEEERRMLYVAMTRAKERLYILTPRRIHNKTAEPSGFLPEIRHPVQKK